MSEPRKDIELLRAFVRNGDQSAFGDIVRRHIDLVYATALRKVEDNGAAEEVAQNVFSTLARKAWRFAPDDSLAAWLYKTTLLEAKEWVRGELRRRRREQTAAELGTTMKTSDEQTAYRALLPLLDEALLSLREKDRTALLLRFYESQSLRDVGVALGVSEDTAQKRVAGALENVSRFFQRRGFKSASVASAAAALQHTTTAAPGFMATSATTAALKAAPVLTGFVVLIGRLLSLSKPLMVSICAIAILVPAIWHWQATAQTSPVNAPMPQHNTQEGSRAQVPPTLPSNEVRPVRLAFEPVREQAVVAPVTIETSQPQKQYSVHLKGFINTPDAKIAILEIQHQPSNASGRPSIVRELVDEGKECDDLSIANDHVRIEFLEANFGGFSARMRENGEEVVYTLESASSLPVGQWNICLVNTRFDQVVDLYAELMNRSILCHPGLNSIPVFAVAEARDRTEAVQALSNILLGKTQTATIMDGESFAVLTQSNQVKSVSEALEKIPYPTPIGPKQSANSINFVNVPLPQVVFVYGQYINRGLISQNRSFSRGVITFHNQTPLEKSEIIYAFDVLMSWQGCKISLFGKDTFGVVSVRTP